MEPHLRPLPTEPATAPERSSPRQRPQRSLPTDRLKMDVQQRLLTAFASLSGVARRTVDSQQLGASLGISGASAGLCNGFFTECGWIERTGKGQYVASDALLDYHRRYAVAPNDPDSMVPLRETMQSSWYFQVLQPMIEQGPVSRRDSLIVLMREAGASRDHLPQINNLLEWLRYVGLIRLEGEHVVLAEPVSPSTADGAGRPSEASSPGAPGSGEPASSSRSDSSVSESTKEGAGTSGPVVLAFSFDVRLTASDLALLSPEQIKAIYEAVGSVAAVTNARR